MKESEDISILKQINEIQMTETENLYDENNHLQKLLNETVEEKSALSYQVKELKSMLRQEKRNLKSKEKLLELYSKNFNENNS